MKLLSELKIPGPTKTTLTEPFWQAVAKGELRIQYCSLCGQHVFYPREICPHCWRDNLSWVSITGKACLRSFTTVWKPGHPGWIEAVPYNVGIVRLLEGPTMLGLILSDKVDPEVGQSLHFETINLAGEPMPAFIINEE